MKKELIETYEDIDLTVKYSYEEHWVDFEAYEIVARGQNENKSFDVLQYEKKNGNNEWVENIEEAQTLIHGAVKWDGCSHFYFGDENGYIHICGKRPMKNLIKAMEEIYNRSGELMESSIDDEFPLS